MKYPPLTTHNPKFLPFFLVYGIYLSIYTKENLTFYPLYKAAKKKKKKKKIQTSTRFLLRFKGID